MCHYNSWILIGLWQFCEPKSSHTIKIKEHSGGNTQSAWGFLSTVPNIIQREPPPPQCCWYRLRKTTEHHPHYWLVPLLSTEHPPLYWIVSLDRTDGNSPKVLNTEYHSQFWWFLPTPTVQIIAPQLRTSSALLHKPHSSTDHPHTFLRVLILLRSLMLTKTLSVLF